MREFEGVSVLVIGDNAYERGVIVDLLRALRVGDIRASHGAVEGFAAMLAHPADVLIADADLKNHSGLQLARELRAHGGRARHKPIVLHSAELSRAFLDAAQHAGVTDVIPKPASRQDLERALTNVLWPKNPAALADRVAVATADRIGQPTLKRADFGPKLDRAARDRILAALDEARAHLALWGMNGGAADLARAREALDRAGADAAQADPAIRQTLTGLRRLVRAPRPDERLITVAVAAARRIAADQDRPQMRLALADAVSEAAAVKARRSKP